MLFVFRLSNNTIAVADEAESAKQAYDELTHTLPEGLDIVEVLQGVDPAILSNLQENQNNLSQHMAGAMVDLSLRNIALLGRAQGLENHIAEMTEKADQDMINIVAATICWQQGINIEDLSKEDYMEAQLSGETFLTGMSMGMEAKRPTQNTPEEGQ